MFTIKLHVWDGDVKPVEHRCSQDVRAKLVQPEQLPAFVCISPTRCTVCERASVCGINNKTWLLLRWHHITSIKDTHLNEIRCISVIFTGGGGIHSHQWTREHQRLRVSQHHLCRLCLSTPPGILVLPFPQSELTRPEKTPHAPLSLPSDEKGWMYSTSEGT